MNFRNQLSSVYMPLVIEPKSSPSDCCNLEHTRGYAVCRLSLIGGCHLIPFMYQWCRRLIHLFFHVVWGCEISFSYYLLKIFFHFIRLLIVPSVPGLSCGILGLVQIALVAYVAGLKANWEISSQLKKNHC